MNALKRIKKVFRYVIDPFINFLVKSRVSPDLITLSALFFVSITSYYIINKNTILAGLFLALTGLIDALDGAVASKVGPTRFGHFFDATIDRIVEIITFIAISIAYPGYHLLTLITLSVSILTSYVAARAEILQIGIEIKYLGFGGRAGRLSILVIAFLLDKLELGLYLIIIAALFTIIGRSFITIKRLRSE